MSDDRRTRLGALLGAIAHPPILILGVQPLLTPRDTRWVVGDPYPLWLPAVMVLGFAGLIGLPLLGASVGSRGWVGPALGKRLTIHILVASFVAGLLATLLSRVAPALGRGATYTVLRLLFGEAGLVTGVVLCFRAPKAPPPA